MDVCSTSKVKTGKDGPDVWKKAVLTDRPVLRKPARGTVTNWHGTT